MRRMHGADLAAWHPPQHVLLRHARGLLRGCRRHHHRRARDGRRAESHSTGVHPARRGAVRILYAGTADGGFPAPPEQSDADRAGYPRRDVRQPLPLRHISKDRARDPGRGGSAESAMTDKRFVVTKVEVEGREGTRIFEVPAFEPQPWTEHVQLDVVGQCVPRMDALEKVTGRAIYTADVRRAGMLHAAIVRSPVANGKVLSIDFGPALEMSGVREVLRREDVDGIKYDSGQLFDTNIRFAGQPLAAVCADTAHAAERAARAVIVKLDAAPHAVTIEAALAPDAPLVRAKGNRAKGSPRVTTRGDVEKGFAAADVVVEREYRTPTVLHTALEPHGAVAEWSGSEVTVWESTQGIFNTRADLAAAFGLKLTQVRVIKDYMGGGFGAKNGAHASTYIAVALAKKAGAAVRCVWDREGEQTDAGNRSATIQRVKIGARRDGTLTAIQLDAEVAMGVGGWFAGPGKIFRELYA